MKTLNLEIYVEQPTEPHVPLVQILPFIDGVTSLRLCLQSKPRSSLSCKIFSDVGRYSQLEHLVLLFFEMRITAFDFFIKKVAKGCLKLRSIKLCKYFSFILTLHNFKILGMMKLILVVFLCFSWNQINRKTSSDFADTATFGKFGRLFSVEFSID